MTENVEINVIVEGLHSWELEEFDYDAFRGALAVAGFDVDEIRFVR